MGTSYSARRLGQGALRRSAKARRSSLLDYKSSASSLLGAFANMAPILLFAVSLGDQRSRQGVFATSRANLPATTCTSTRLLSLIKSACTRGKSFNVIIKLNL